MVSDREFEKLVIEAVNSLGEKFLKRLNNVVIVIEQEPRPEQIKKLKIKNGFLFGLYEGVPQTQRQSYGMVLPDKITIFKKEIERACSNPSEIKELVKNVIWHEIAHHFGMSEEDIKKTKRR